MYIFTYCFIMAFCLKYEASAQIDPVNENITDISTTSKMPITLSSTVSSATKPPTNISCETHNNDCKACVKRTACYYCGSTNKCHRHWERVITDGECDMNHAYFLTCKTTFKVMMIVVGSLSGILILIVTVVCCCCCCKKKGIKISKDDIKWARQREERKQIALERRKERAERTEEIRKKYGLVKDSNPYQRFDA